MGSLNVHELETYLTGYWLTDLANFSAFLFENLHDINWVGFYLSDGRTLRLGPFCGKPACTEVPIGRGVCGVAFAKGQTQIVDDVDLFPGHIRCDSNSKSEIVIPISVSGKSIGVLDVDSPSYGRFTPNDKDFLESCVQILSLKISNYAGAKYGSIT